MKAEHLVANSGNVASRAEVIGPRRMIPHRDWALSVQKLVLWRFNDSKSILSQEEMKFIWLYGDTVWSPYNIHHLTHWGWVMHVCVSKLSIIGSDNGLSPGRRQAIIWTKAGMLLIGSLGTNFSEALIRIQTFSLKKLHLKMASVKWILCCISLNELNGKVGSFTWFLSMSAPSTSVNF